MLGYKYFFLLAMLVLCGQVFSQKSTSKIVNTSFPDNWDIDKELRGKSGQVLAWAHFKANKKEQSKSCLTLRCWEDSSKTHYSISAMHSYEEPFNKWRHGYLHYPGFLDTHIKGFDHKPTEKELTDLLLQWNYCLISKDVKTVEAGIDEKLWLVTFGFIPDKKIFLEK